MKLATRLIRWLAIALPIATSAIIAAASAPAGATPSSLLMVGDSLTQGSLNWQTDDFAGAGWGSAAVDGSYGRAIRYGFLGSPSSGLHAVDELRAAHGDSPTWVVALGTNDVSIHAPSEYHAAISEMATRIGTGHRIVWVNIYLPNDSSRQNAWNAALSDFAAADPANFIVADWATYATGQPGWLHPDGIHYTTDGYRARSSWVAQQSRALLGQMTAVPWNQPDASAEEQAGGYVATSPQRVLDSRPDRIRGGTHITVGFSGRVPAGSTAVAVNVTATDPGGAGYFTVWPCDRPQPNTSNVNFAAGRTASSLSLVRIDPTGRLCLFASTDAGVIVDLFGSFTPGQGLRLTPVAAMRIADTRSAPGSGLASAGTTLRISTSAANGAVMANLTTDRSAHDGYLTAWGCDGPQPGSSNLNYHADAGAVANAAIIPIGPSGELCIYTSQATAIIVDVTATFENGRGLQYQAVNPHRMLDTRVAVGGWVGFTSAGQTITVPIPQAAGRVAVGTLTAVGAGGGGYLTTWSGTEPVPNVSSLNVQPADTTQNVIASPVASDDQFRVFAGGTAHAYVVFDLTGWFI